MDMNAVNVPKRRFAGFTGEWELRKLEDVSEYVKGFAIPMAWEGWRRIWD